MKHDTTNDPSESNPRSTRSSLVRLAAVIIFICAAVFTLGIGWADEIDASSISLAFLATFPLMIAAVVVAGWRLAVLSGGKITSQDGVAVNAVAQLIVLIVPSRVSEAAKPIGLGLFYKVPLASGFAILALERILDAAFLAGIGLAVVGVLGGPFGDTVQSSSVGLAIVAAVGVSLILVVAARPVWLHGLIRKIPIVWVRKQLDHVFDAISHLANPGAAGLAVGLTALTWIVSYLIFFVFFQALQIGNLSPGQILVVFVASTLGLIISVAPGGLGTFEAAIAIALAGFGFPMATAIASALLLRLCLVVPVVALAGWYLFSSNMNLPGILDQLRSRKGIDDQPG